MGKDNKVHEFCCAICGSTNIQMQAWVKVNTHEYVDNIGDDNDCWCEDCCSHTIFITKDRYENSKTVC